MTATLEQRRALAPGETASLLARYGIATPRETIARTVAEVAAAVRTVGPPVVLKAFASGLLHRSDVGGVRVGVQTPDEAVAAAEEMSARIRVVSGFLIQQQVATGVEVIIGAKRDPIFGPVVVVGLGGIWVESIGDSALRLAPVTTREAATMLDELRGAAVLRGSRGQQPLDRGAVVDLLVSLSRLMTDDASIAEVDLNPVIVHERGAVVVDAKVITEAATAAERRAPPPKEVMDRLIAPRSIAVVGASASRSKQGGRLFHYLIKHGYAGTLYPVNPGRDNVMGRAAFASVDDLPEVPDLVCIAVPAENVASVLDASGRRGVQAAMVLTSGFAETGEVGAKNERHLVEVARHNGLRVCGPNTAGIVNTDVAMCAAIGMAFEVDAVPQGNVSFLTQSGALGSALLSRSWAQGVGIRKWIATGNSADIRLADYLGYLVDDPGTDVIALFIEAIDDAETFFAAARRAREHGKRIVAYKTGSSPLGQRAVRSHTAALAGDDATYSAALRAAGVARVHDLQTLMDCVIALSWQPLPRGRRIGVITASGGACSVVADDCARWRLELPRFGDQAHRRIAEIVPSFGVSQNPIDLTMQLTSDPSIAGRVAQIVLEDPDIDALVLLMTTNADPPAAQIAREVAAVARDATKPIIVTRLGAEFLAPEALSLYREARIPVFVLPEQAVRTLGVMADLGAMR